MDLVTEEMTIILQGSQERQVQDFLDLKVHLVIREVVVEEDFKVIGLVIVIVKMEKEVA